VNRVRLWLVFNIRMRVRLLRFLKACDGPLAETPGNALRSSVAACGIGFVDKEGATAQNKYAAFFPLLCPDGGTGRRASFRS
jgi:hypothetical protein